MIDKKIIKALECYLYYLLSTKYKVIDNVDPQAYFETFQQRLLYRSFRVLTRISLDFPSKEEDLVKHLKYCCEVFIKDIAKVIPNKYGTIYLRALCIGQLVENNCINIKFCCRLTPSKNTRKFRKNLVKSKFYRKEGTQALVI